MKRYGIGAVFVMLLHGLAIAQAPTEGVAVVKEDGKFQLYVDGTHTYIKGVGGTHSLNIASQSGANAFRTWSGSVESIRKDVALAEQNGMYIMQGIGLTKDSAAYFDSAYKNKVREHVRELVETYRDEPRILAWALGNEIDLGNANIGAAWQFVEELAQLIKSIDNRHAVISVVAHSQAALDSIARFAPSLDFVGINSYGSIVEIGEMVDRSDYQGAFMVTEWGPSGFWEVPETAWGAPIEQTSEEKRLIYEHRYNDYILANDRCLGSFVFLWGQKEERTPTWFSMFLEQDVDGLPFRGEKTPQVEAMQRVWSGTEPMQTAPVIQSMTINGEAALDNVRVGASIPIAAQVLVSDREQDSLSYVWEILEEATVLGFGGSYEPRPDRYGQPMFTEENRLETTVNKPGNYRLYVYVLDNTGFAATVNIPFQVTKR
ncbi:hypothetical protein [Parapedobacter sp. 10938]|uniref:hypothetical protein n=1 Tax=Parapedobacter flavus TaxID=3110225 RepID=UPI002DB9B6C2|nr:hypothetical protein [Parapedobacter sp. 10938]MEC3878099.1 hypothetical protein [Parapedobacter sp. 10938]